MIELIESLTRNGPLWLWCYNGCMEIVNFREHQYNRVGAKGVCPHCAVRSLLNPVGASWSDSDAGTGETLIASIAQCQACRGLALVVGRRRGQNPQYELADVYPLSKPDERVDETVPEQVASDFKEALRCCGVRAHKAAVVMCRRAIEASALERGTSRSKNLVEQIDDLAERGAITQSLREMAHEVRLTGNVGAHPDEDGLENVTDQDAADITEFTREYLHHVYVMPAKLEARHARAAAAAPAPVPTAKATR